MIRISVGIEDIEDLLSDIDNALNKSFEWFFYLLYNYFFD